MSTIIRAGDVPRLARRLSSVDLADHLEEARAVVVDAQARAKRMLDDAASQAGRLGPAAQQKGYDKGYREGFDKGYREGTKKGADDGYAEAHACATERFDRQHAAIVSDFARLIDEITGQREAIQLAAKKDLLDFAISVATKLTYRVGTLNRQAARANLERALDLVQSKTDLTIRVHPDDLSAIEAFAGSLPGISPAVGGYHVVPDPQMAPGGCIVSNEYSKVDAALETQIEEVVTLLVGDQGDRGIRGEVEDAPDV